MRRGGRRSRERPAGSAGPRRGREPFQFPEQTAREASLGRTRDQERGQGFEKGNAEQGERSVTLTLLHAKKTGSSGLRGHARGSAGTCCGQERAPARPPLPGSGWALSALQPQAGAVPSLPPGANLWSSPTLQAPSERAGGARGALSAPGSILRASHGVPRAEVSAWAATGPPSPR